MVGKIRGKICYDACFSPDVLLLLLLCNKNELAAE
jgi:hypothetical protein